MSQTVDLNVRSEEEESYRVTPTTKEELISMIGGMPDQRAKAFFALIGSHPDLVNTLSFYTQKNGAIRTRDSYCRQSLDRFDVAVETCRQQLINWMKPDRDAFMPDDILYSIRSECQLGCRYCYQGQVPGNVSGRLGVNDAVKFHQQAMGKKDKTAFGFWGGEPIADLNESLEWTRRLSGLGGKITTPQTNGESIREYNEARRFLEAVAPILKKGKSPTICVDAERATRFKEKYGYESLEWAKNILQAWLDTDSLENFSIRFVHMRDDTTRFELISYLMSLGIEVEDFVLTFNKYPNAEAGGEETVTLEPYELSFKIKETRKKLEFFSTHPFYIGGAEEADLGLMFSDEVETRFKEKGHPECGTHWVVKPSGQVVHCVTLDYTDVHDIGNISEGYDALVARYNADLILTMLRDPLNRRRTLWQIACTLDPSIAQLKFNPIAPMCQFLFSDSGLKLRITKLLALNAIRNGEMSFREGVPEDVRNLVDDRRTEEDLTSVSRYIVK